MKGERKETLKAAASTPAFLSWQYNYRLQSQPNNANFAEIKIIACLLLALTRSKFSAPKHQQNTKM